jgi:hypothetical protein
MNTNWYRDDPNIKSMKSTKEETCMEWQRVGIGKGVGYGLDDPSSEVRFPVGAGNFSLNHRVQNGSGAHPASYLVGIRDSYPGVKAAGTWS